ncbi:MAG: hypothetical protein ACE5Q7_04450, partial [Candidatus Nitrosomaritimum yanchengensis]
LKSCVLEGLHLPLKYFQKKMRIVPMTTTDQGKGSIVITKIQIPIPSELTPNPNSIERRARGIFIHNRPKAFEGFFE